jgi:hypothetical protein
LKTLKFDYRVQVTLLMETITNRLVYCRVDTSVKRGFLRPPCHPGGIEIESPLF